MVWDGRQSAGSGPPAAFIQHRRRIPGTPPARAARIGGRFPPVHSGSADEPSGGLRTPFTLPSNAPASLSVQRATLTTGWVARRRSSKNEEVGDRSRGRRGGDRSRGGWGGVCRLEKRSEEHTSELQSPDHLVC